MKKLLFLGLLALTACATVEPAYMRDGVMVYRATCNGAVRDIGACYQMASKQCAGNFEVINTIEENIATMYNRTGRSDTTYELNSRSTTSSFAGSKQNVINRSLFFYCKE